MNAGIYQIKALHNNKVYIGSSTNLEQRKRDHFRFLRYGTHDNPKLQAAYNKHGRDNFVFEVLMSCDPEDCLAYEQQYFDSENPHYNIVMVAGKPPSRRGCTWTATEEQRARMKASAIDRGARQRAETAEKMERICEELYASGLSIRKFCKEFNPPTSRDYLNVAYRKYKDALKETTA